MNLLYLLYIGILNILAELYTLNYIKLIITSFLVKTFIYINSILFQFLNLELTLLYSLIPILIGVSFYFSKNKLQFFVR